MKIEKEKVYVRASKQVRVWPGGVAGAQVRGREAEVGAWAQGAACVKPCGGREPGECGRGAE